MDLTTHPMPARGVATRLWRHFPSYLLAACLLAIGVLLMSPTADERFVGSWRWVFAPPGPRVWGVLFCGVGALHCVAWFCRWRIRYGTMLALFPIYVLIAVKLSAVTHAVTPGTLVYAGIAVLAVWVIRWHRLFE